MEFLKENDKKYVSDLFSKNLSGDVNIMLFADPPGKCEYCGPTRQLLEELAELDNRIRLTVYDINKNSKEARFLGVDKTPAMVLGGKKIYNVYYYGMPIGHEFSAFLEDIVDVSAGATKLSESTKKALKEISKPIDIKVFVTPTCPWCPRAVRTAHQFAIENSNIRSSMIESMEFSEMASAYSVMAVPKIVINETMSFEGALPERQFLEYVKSA